MDWVDAAQVVGAIATAGALIFVGLQTKHSRNSADAAQRMHELESARDAKALENETRRQAGHVTVWPAKRTVEGWGVVISNTSPSPVFAFELVRGDGRTKSNKPIPALRARAEVLPSGLYFFAESKEQPWIQFLAAGEEITPVIGNADYMPELRFRDSDGKSWRRDCTGTLTEMTNSR